MSNFICPICGEKLLTKDKSLSCKKNHSFDKSKSGYVNLLLSQQIKAKHHGDDKLMVKSRQAFLDKGFYNLLLKAICEILKEYTKNEFKILDAGCGECWYTANIYESLLKQNIKTIMFAIDISKDALAFGAKRNREIELAVASVFKLPVAANYCDMLLSVFAPFSEDEFKRVLKKDGILIRVFPLEKHLMRLKAVVYDNPYENEIELSELNGFKIIDKREIKGVIHLSSNEDIKNLFTMTPYYYKTSSEDQKKLHSLGMLETETEFGILVYRKK
ncbi:MAG: methyltransferase [Clostridiales bacterium GWF2_36_10]|nr:MAG: methyltransferase [Clostridiales bacterium GWF2_36_10]HAN21988.1 methyltransferase [Clostridiales bacterium]